MRSVAVDLERLLALAPVGDGLLPSGRIGHALALLGPTVGDVIVFLGGEHGPHDRLTPIDVFGYGRRFDLDVRALDLASAEAHGGLGARGDGRDRCAAAGAALAGHGEDVHVRLDAHVPHGALPGGGDAIALGALVDHGDVLEDDVAVGPLFETGLHAGEKLVVGDAAAAAFVR